MRRKQEKQASSHFGYYDTIKLQQIKKDLTDMYYRYKHTSQKCIILMIVLDRLDILIREYGDGPDNT